MTLNQEITLLKKKLQQLADKIIELQQNNADKTPTPYSKVGFDRYLGNKDVVFDGLTGLWKSYAVYKDEEEE